MDVYKTSQSTIKTTQLIVERANGEHVAFDGQRLHRLLSQLTDDPTTIHRTESLVLAQLSGFRLVATQTITEIITNTLKQLGYQQLAPRYLAALASHHV